MKEMYQTGNIFLDFMFGKEWCFVSDISCKVILKMILLNLHSSYTLNSIRKQYTHNCNIAGIQCLRTPVAQCIKR